MDAGDKVRVEDEGTKIYLFTRGSDAFVCNVRDYQFDFMLIAKSYPLDKVVKI